MRSLKRVTVLGLVAGLSVTFASTAFGGHGRHRGGCAPECDAAPCEAAAPCEPAPAPKMVERTIMVPQTVTENRTVKCTEYTNETREKKITVMNRVPKTQTVTREYTVLVPKTETRTVSYQVCKPVMKQETETYNVCVPHTETKNGVRKVCKQVSVPKTRKVTVDQGHWETAAPAPVAEAGCGSPAPCNSGCGHRHRRGCGGCGDCGSGCAPVACRHWVPNLVEKEVAYTACEVVTEDVPYTYNVVTMKSETSTRTVNRCHHVMETLTKEVPYTTCVAEKKSKTFEVQTFECVPAEKTVSYTVCVPHQVEKQVQVQVVKMVPKTVTVPECGGCDSAPCGHGRRCRGC